MAKLSIISDIDAFCGKCDSPLDVSQDPMTHTVFVAPCPVCTRKYDDAIKRLIKKMEVAAC